MSFSLRIATFLSVILCVQAAYGYNYPELKWKTFKTKHFVIHYYEDVEWTARKVSVVAEEIYPKVTGIYKHEPKSRTHIVVRDDEDRSNGFAVFQLGWITIWASPTNLPVRGRSDWIRGVITHEFAHIVSLQASSGGGFRIEGLRFGSVANENNKYNTDIGGTVFVPINPYARWWAEGTAQLDTDAIGYDPWDTYRDMLLRASVLEGTLLSFEEMRNITVREHFGGELVYNQGFAFLMWLRKTYGLDANIRLTETQEKHWHLDFDRSFPKAIGKTAKELYGEWKDYLEKHYGEQVREIRKSPIEGKKIPLRLETEKEADEDARPPLEEYADTPYDDGLLNFFPRFSPDGHWLSWINTGILKLRYLNTPFDLSSLEKSEDSDGNDPTSLALEFSGSYYTWAPDSQTLLTSRRRTTPMRGFPYYDAYRIDLGQMVEVRKQYLKEFSQAKTDQGREEATKRYKKAKKRVDISDERITHKLRATHLRFSPDGKTVAFSQNRDGHRHLRLMNPDGTKARDLVAIGGDAEALDAVWSPDGKNIAFTLFNHGQADIWMVSPNGGDPWPLTFDKADDREPAFTPDGTEIIFSSNRSGISQLYRLPANATPGTRPVAITNLETGAFTPYVSPKTRKLLYSRFTSYGFRPYEMALGDGPQTFAGKPDRTLSKEAAKQLTPETYPAIKGKRYSPWPRPVRIFPSFIVEDEQFKAGIALQVSDFLEKHSLTTLALFGEDQDYQISYQNRVWYPTIHASYTAYIRNSALLLFSDGDAIVDDPGSAIRDNIQFLDVGISKDFRFYSGFKGNHTLHASYNRRFVDRRIGHPTPLSGTVRDSFRLLTNDGFSVGWRYDDRPSRPKKEFDINPRDYTHVSLQYSLVHTSRFSADTSIPTPNKDYLYHEGTMTLGHYVKLPFEKPWWEHHTYWVKFTGGYKSRDVTSDDEFFLGGRINFRAFGEIASNTLFYGYDDFSISGETMMLLATGYTFPLAREMNKKFGFFFLDSIYASVFFEAGNAWSYGEFKNLDQNPTRDPSLGDGQVLLGDVGVEVKMKAFLFNDFNRWNSVFRVAYGFQDQAKYGFSDSDNPVRFFIGIGTDF